MNRDFIENVKRIAVYIRFDIENDSNIPMINNIINRLNGVISDAKMCENISRIRPDIKLVNTGDRNILSGEINRFLIISVTVLKDKLTDKKYSEAYDIADLIQALPDFEYLNNKESMNSFFEVHVKELSEKYPELENIWYIR